MDINEFITSIRNIDYLDACQRLYTYMIELSNSICPNVYIDTYPEYTLYYSYTPNYIKLYAPNSLKGVTSRYQSYTDYGWIEFDFKSSFPDRLQTYIDRFIQDLHKVYSLSSLSTYFYPYVNPCPHVHLHWLSSVMNCYRSLKLVQPDYRTFATLRRELIADIRSKFPHLLIEESEDKFTIGDLVVSTRIQIYNEVFTIFECKLGEDIHKGSISAKIGMETIVEFYSKFMQYLQNRYPYNYLTLNSYLPPSLQMQSQEQMTTLVDLIFSTYSSICRWNKDFPESD